MRGYSSFANGEYCRCGEMIIHQTLGTRYQRSSKPQGMALKRAVRLPNRYQLAIEHRDEKCTWRISSSTIFSSAVEARDAATATCARRVGGDPLSCLGRCFRHPSPMQTARRVRRKAPLESGVFARAVGRPFSPTAARGGMATVLPRWPGCGASWSGLSPLFRALSALGPRKAPPRLRRTPACGSRCSRAAGHWAARWDRRRRCAPSNGHGRPSGNHRP
jgi:hypothetical protein